MSGNVIVTTRQPVARSAANVSSTSRTVASAS